MVLYDAVVRSATAAGVKKFMLIMQLATGFALVKIATGKPEFLKAASKGPIKDFLQDCWHF